MDEQLARGLDAEGLEHAGPVDSVRGRQDVLADDMDVSGPESLVGHCGVIIGQRIEPDVGDEGRVKGQFDAPGSATICETE